MIRKAILVGATNVEFEMYNRSGKKLTSDIVGRLDQLSVDYMGTLRKPDMAGETSRSADFFAFILRVVIAG